MTRDASSDGVMLKPAVRFSTHSDWMCRVILTYTALLIEVGLVDWGVVCLEILDGSYIERSSN